MASGLTHAKVTVVASMGLFPATLLVPGLGISALGCLAGVLISPDLDQDGATISERLLMRGGFWLIGAPWFLYWLPYAKLFPHRHWLTHFPVVGTLGRLLYLSPAWILMLVLLGLPGRHVWWLIGWLVVGLMVSDFLHWLLDRPLVMPGYGGLVFLR